jgi:hypothetical protein
MRRLVLSAASVLALCVVLPAQAAPIWTLSAEDGDETTFFNNKKSLNAGNDAFFGEVGFNGSREDVDVTTNGTIKNLGNGNSTVDGTDSGSDFLTSLTFTPHAPFTTDGIFFRGQIDNIPNATGGVTDGEITIAVNGKDGSSESFTVKSLGTNDDFTELGIESVNDLTQIASVTITAGAGEFFEEFKQVDFSGAGGVPVTQQGGVPEPAAWIVMLAGFGLAGTLLRRRSRVLMAS